MIFRPRVDEEYRRLAFEMRGGEAPNPFDVQFDGSTFRKIDTESVRITREKLGAKEDKERLRKKDVLLGLIIDQAEQGKLYTAHALASTFEGKNDLGGVDSITRRLNTLQTQGWIRFTKNYKNLDVEIPKSTSGLMVVEGLVLHKTDPETGEVEETPATSTHYRSDTTGAILEVPKGLSWPPDPDEKPKD